MASPLENLPALKGKWSIIRVPIGRGTFSFYKFPIAVTFLGGLIKLGQILWPVCISLMGQELSGDGHLDTTK